MNSLVFFRNDDVRDAIDLSLQQISNIFIENEIPLIYAVEPANVNKKVIDWLLNLKTQFPELIEIVQHGYNHNLNYQSIIYGKVVKGEFGGQRSYTDQYQDIYKGKLLMNKYFDNNWFPAFTFPYGARNKHTIKALNECGYKVINGSMAPGILYNSFYRVGRLLLKESFFGKKISWNLKYRPNVQILQVDTSISLISKFNDELYSADFYTLDELKSITIKYLKSLPNVGFVLHHRYHNSKDKIQILKDFLPWIKSNKNLRFCKLEDFLNIDF